MAAISTAQATQLKRRSSLFKELARKYGDGFWKFLENFDATTGVLSVTVADTVAGTNATAFTVGIASGTTPRISLAENTGKTGDYTLTVKPGTLGASRTVLFPDSLGANDVIVTTDLAQTLLNKTLTSPVLTTPTIASFVNATHTHADAANGGTISVPASLTGTSGTTFTIGVGGTIPKAAITVLGSTGDYTATLQIPTLVASRTITFPAVTCTLASITGTETLTNKTLTSPAMTLPTIQNGLLASGSVSNDFSASTGTFKTSAGAVTIGSGAVGITGAVTMATTKGITFGAAAAGTATPLTMYSLTANKGALIIAVADATGDYATTLTNGDPLAAATITLPAATGTLAALNGANTWTAAQVIANDDASNTSGTDLLTLTHTTSGTAGANIAAGIKVIIENLTDITTETSSIDFITTNDATKAALDTDVLISTMLGGGFSKALLIDASAQEVVIGDGSVSDGDGLDALRIYPRTTAARGSLRLVSAINGTGNFTTTVTQATDVSEAQTITIPDAAGATDTFSLIATAQTFSAVKTFSAAPIISTTSAGTNAAVTVLTVGHSSSGTAAAGFGPAISLQATDASGNLDEVATISAVLSTATHGATESADVVLKALIANALAPAITVDVSDLSVTLGSNATNAGGISKLRIFPVTASKGSILIAAVANTGDSVTTITNAAQGGAYTYTIPDAGGNTSFVMAAGAQTVAGAKTFSTMPLLGTPATVAATGSTQADAAPITTGFTLVTNDSAAKGIALPAAVAGAVCIVKNTYAGVTKVWPAVGASDTINGAAADATMVGGLPSLTSCIFFAYDATQWFSIPLVPS